VLDDEDSHGVACDPDDEDEDTNDCDGDECGGGKQGSLIVVVVYVVLVRGLCSTSMKVHLGSGPGHANLAVWVQYGGKSGLWKSGCCREKKKMDIIGLNLCFL